MLITLNQKEYQEELLFAHVGMGSAAALLSVLSDIETLGKEGGAKTPVLSCLIKHANELMGTEEFISMKGESLSMEGLADLSTKAYRVIADLITRFINWIRGFFTKTVSDMTEDLTGNVTAFNELKEEVKMTTKVARDLGIDLMEPLTKETEDLLTSHGAEVRKGKGKLLVTDATLSSDLTDLIPSHLRQREEYTYIVDYKHGLKGIEERLKMFLDYSKAMLTIGPNDGYSDYGRRLFSIKNKEDLTRLAMHRKEGPEKHRSDIIEYFRAPAKLVKPFRPKKIMGTVPVVLLPASNGQVKLIQMKVTEIGAANKYRITYNLSITESGLDNLFELNSKIIEVIASLGVALNKSTSVIQELSAGKGAPLIEAINGLEEFRGGADDNLLLQLKHEMRSFAKNAIVSSSHLTTAVSIGESIHRALDMFIRAMLTKA